MVNTWVKIAHFQFSFSEITFLIPLMADHLMVEGYRSSQHKSFVKEKFNTVKNVSVLSSFNLKEG